MIRKTKYWFWDFYFFLKSYGSYSLKLSKSFLSSFYSDPLPQRSRTFQILDDQSNFTNKRPYCKYQFCEIYRKTYFIEHLWTAFFATNQVNKYKFLVNSSNTRVLDMFKVNNKDTRTSSMTSFWCLYC